MTELGSAGGRTLPNRQGTGMRSAPAGGGPLEAAIIRKVSHSQRRSRGNPCARRRDLLAMAAYPQQLPESGKTDGEGANGREELRGRVTFPLAVQNQSTVESLKLEVEESAESMSPRNMWQVYALGGFMVLSWLWGRWKERRGRVPPP